MTPTLLLALYARPLLHGYAIRRFRRHRDLLSLDEIRSIADEGIFEACRRFDPEKGAFVAFARFWVRRQLHRAVAHELVWQRKRVGEGDTLFQAEIDERETLECLEEQVTARDLVGRIEPTAYDMWAMHVDGRPIREVARAYGLSVRQVRQQLERARVKLGAVDDTRMSRSKPARSVHKAARRAARASVQWEL